MTRQITRKEFELACEAVWSEIIYQDALPRRTEDEAKEPTGFATLGHVYLRHLENAWSDNPGIEATLPILRKLTTIFLRGMIYCGINFRDLS